MTRFSLFRLAPLFLVLLAGCGPGPGEPCETSGGGFTRTDPCAYTCVDWPVLCADGSTATPDVCSGSGCTDDSSCQMGWGCVQINATDSACLPADVCSGGFGVGQPMTDVDAGDTELPPADELEHDLSGGDEPQ